MAHHILLYDYVEEMLERRRPYRDAHLARVRTEQDAGRIVMAGALGDPPHGAALVFSDGVERSEIEAFVDADPYVTAGLVASHRIERWNVV